MIGIIVYLLTQTQLRERTQSQVEFFKMLDAKIEEGADYTSEEDWKRRLPFYLDKLFLYIIWKFWANDEAEWDKGKWDSSPPV